MNWKIYEIPTIEMLPRMYATLLASLIAWYNVAERKVAFEDPIPQKVVIPDEYVNFKRITGL